MVVKAFAADQPVFSKGDIGDSIYFIISGNVKLHEQEMTIAEMTTTDFFGEFSLLDNEPRSLSVTCTVPSQLAALHREDFYMVLKEHPESIRDIIEALIKRIRNQNNKIFIFLKNREKELAEEVNRKTIDLQRKNGDLSEALDKLKQTQQQLVIQEMLAALGQLTAGIAHSIKNPLNFINNFSLVSLEMLSEIGKINDEEEKNEIIISLKQNLEKIHHHGKRADNIVDNMLQHSMSGSGEKQKVNLNTMLDEIYSIALQNYQENNPGFNCKLTKELKVDLPEVDVSTKEILRVMLNLLYNAFDAVEEKRRNAGAKNGYSPLIILSTGNMDNKVSVSVKDNGPGVPEEIRERIFEPFFTTKDTWHGNGLGLSMSNEIIKMHGGEIKLNTEMGDGAEFVVVLPV